MKQPKIILGFVGNFCAGKGEVINYLVEKYGFYASSCSDRVREELKRQGQEITRATLQPMAGEMRQKFGLLVFAERTWKEILDHEVDKAVIDSIMSGEEVEFLKKIPNFSLIWVDADQKLRYQRMLSRGRGDPKTWKEFLVSEKKNLVGDGRNLPVCFAAADYKIENNGSLKELHQKIDEVLKTLSYKGML